MNSFHQQLFMIPQVRSRLLSAWRYRHHFWRENDEQGKSSPTGMDEDDGGVDDDENASDSSSDTDSDEYSESESESESSSDEDDKSGSDGKDANAPSSSSSASQSTLNMPREDDVVTQIVRMFTALSVSKQQAYDPTPFVSMCHFSLSLCRF